jgi:hypothetical protein
MRRPFHGLTPPVPSVLRRLGFGTASSIACAYSHASLTHSLQALQFAYSGLQTVIYLERYTKLGLSWLGKY